ncbi:hypothetical protein SAMN04488503_2018 [Humidesulfovibrio mexicanus]|uniref:Uncharacterized protein n=1 Tax=Humidesulfovibrio mexicanus TaxID=147047 RepID=A0A239AJ92_9BACT|nr:hypothetical protein [Humidesulfovibrio mexicanus]SNR95609.1 hypothetical protein SAMN04488503_2018 [Humidesulfovibrio mexicanus]
MRLHFEGDHPEDVARNVKVVLNFLGQAVIESNPRVDLLGGDGRAGLGVIMVALENSVGYIEQRCEAMACGQTARRATVRRAHDS